MILPSFEECKKLNAKKMLTMAHEVRPHFGNLAAILLAWSALLERIEALEEEVDKLKKEVY